MYLQLQQLLEEKIIIYESIMDEIKHTDTALYFKFYDRLCLLESIDKKMNTDPELVIEKLMKMSL